MKTKILILGLSLAFVAAACNRNSPTPTAVNGFSEIKITSDGFEPSELSVKKGTAVTYTNNDTKSRWPASAPHPTHTDYPEFDRKQPLTMGESWSFTFEKSGTWKYHDHLNPAHRGKVTVTE